MKTIKKISQAIAYVGKALNSRSTSTQDTYSCDYINNKIVYDDGIGYMRFENGLQICWGSLYILNEWTTISFAQSFKHIPLVTVTLDTDDAQTTTLASTKIANKTTTGFNVCAVSANGYGPATINYIAIGRWNREE